MGLWVPFAKEVMLTKLDRIVIDKEPMVLHVSRKQRRFILSGVAQVPLFVSPSIIVTENLFRNWYDVKLFMIGTKLVARPATWEFSVIKNTLLLFFFVSIYSWESNNHAPLLLPCFSPYSPTREGSLITFRCGLGGKWGRKLVWIKRSQWKSLPWKQTTSSCGQVANPRLIKIWNVASGWNLKHWFMYYTGCSKFWLYLST